MNTISGFDPVMPWSGYAVAKGYMDKLNKFGHLVMALAGSNLVFFIVTPIIAMAFSLIVFMFALYLGKEYRRYDKELVKRTNIFGLVRILTRAWQFWVAMFLFLSLGVGIVQWPQVEIFKAFVSWVGVLGLFFEFFVRPKLSM